jgi:hypothetical protein
MRLNADAAEQLPVEGGAATASNTQGLGLSRARAPHQDERRSLFTGRRGVSTDSEFTSVLYTGETETRGHGLGHLRDQAAAVTATTELAGVQALRRGRWRSTTGTSGLQIVSSAAMQSTVDTLSVANDDTREIPVSSASTVSIERLPSILQLEDGSRRAEIPADLLRYLEDGLYGALNKPAYAARFAILKPSQDTCVLTDVIKKKSPSKWCEGRVGTSACTTCAGVSSTFKAPRRPCVLLEMVDDVRTVVFLPLASKYRGWETWRDKGYWVMPRVSEGRGEE